MKNKKLVVRTLEQMSLHYEDHVTQPRPAVRLEDLPTLDDAESLKTALMAYAPSSDKFNEPELSKASALWNRVALQRMRFRGQRHHYLVVRSLDLRRRLLVLQVPADGLSTQETLEHAAKQMTYSDDLNGRYQPGLRLKDSFVDHIIEGEEHYRSGVLYGFPMRFTEQPVPVRLPNYVSYEVEHRDKVELDTERQCAAGYLEELLYYPTIVNPQGAVVKGDKCRPVVDCTASGLNKILVPLPCKYDLLEDTIAGLLQLRAHLWQVWKAWQVRQVWKVWQVWRVWRVWQVWRVW